MNGKPVVGGANIMAGSCAVRARELGGWRPRTSAVVGASVMLAGGLVAVRAWLRRRQAPRKPSAWTRVEATPHEARIDLAGKGDPDSSY